MTIRSASYPAYRPIFRPALAAARRRAAAMPRFASDFAVVLAVLGVYFLGRGLAPDRLDFAVALTNQLVALEKSLGIFWEPAVQRYSIEHRAVQEAANFVYAYMHFPVLAVVAVWLRIRDRERFVFVRNVMFISMAIGLLFYYAMPAAPPRLMAMHGYDMGFVDTVFGGDTAVRYAQPSLILNEYAAIPSFHFGWIAMASAAIWVNTRSRLLRIAAVLLTLVMTWAIVASANHLFIDMALGGLVIAFSWWLAGRIERRGTTSRVGIEPTPIERMARAA